MVIITLRRSQMYCINRDYNIKSGKRYGTLRYIFGGVFGTSSPPRVHPLSAPVARSGWYGPWADHARTMDAFSRRANRGGETFS